MCERRIGGEEYVLLVDSGTDIDLAEGHTRFVHPTG